MLVLASAMTLALNLDLKPLVPDLSQKISSQFDRDISIGGAVGIDLSDQLGLWVTLDNVSINERMSLETSDSPIRADVAQVRVLVHLLPLLEKRIAIGELKLVDANIAIVPARNFDVTMFNKNIEFAVSETQVFELSVIKKLSFERGKLQFIAGGETEFEVKLDRASAQPGEIGLSVLATGTIEGQEVRFHGTTGPLMALLTGHRIFLDGVFESGSAQLQLDGSFGDISTVGLDLLAKGDAPQLNDVALLLGFKDVKRNTATTFTANIRGTKQHFYIDDISAGIGRGDLYGFIEVEQGEGFSLKAELRSDLLDLDSFSGMTFSRPPTRLFSDEPLPTDLLRSAEVDLTYKAESILLANALLNDGQIRVLMSDGILAANPIGASFLDGSFISSLMVDARIEPYFRAEASMENFDLGRFLADMNVMGEFQARLDFGMALEGEGESLANMLANAKGQTNLLIGEGRLSESAVELIGKDLADQLRLISTDPNNPSPTQNIDLECAVSRFDIDRGMATSRAFLVQTKNTITTGRGEVNLGIESINLRLAPRPKNPELLHHATDVKVGGSFVHPIFYLDQDKLSRGIAGALGRFALARAADEELLPLLPTGQPEQNACIDAFIGSRDGPKGFISIYDDFDNVRDFDFRKAGRGQ
jgi:uncharacterized protein involved in outer membrane biogenesis